MDNSGMTLERAEAAVRKILAIEDITPGMNGRITWYVTADGYFRKILPPLMTNSAKQSNHWG